MERKKCPEIKSGEVFRARYLVVLVVLNNSMAVMFAYPSCNSIPASPDSNSHKTFDSLQRRKIGSIRDNPKLFKIRQQFENSCLENEAEKSPKDFSKSSTSSSKVNSPISNNSPIFVFGSKSSTTKVIHSAGNDLPVENENGNKMGTNLLRKERKLSLKAGNSEQASGIPNESQILKCSIKNSYNVNQNRKEFAISNNRPSNAADILPNSSGSETKQITAPIRNILLESNNCSPRRSSETEISEKYRNDSLFTLPEKLSKTLLENAQSLNNENVPNSSEPESLTHRSLPALSAPLKTATSAQNVIKENSVKKAILIYEGLSKTDLLNSKNQPNVIKYPKTVCRKESFTSNAKRDGICRRSSRRNSIRKSLAPPAKDDSSKSVSPMRKKDNTDSGIVFKHAKADSGVGLSETEDILPSKTDPQSVYQTLDINLPKHFDPYDRLQRIHDMVSRIHKGQSSTCAACKAIPSSNLQCSRVQGTSLLQVKCNEMSPHHHPPCVCFSCQHSIFSCSQNMTANTSLSLDNLSTRGDEDSLYYNLCCLESPSCDSWRRSRRRPVCEQNGRLCVVNCDMERSAFKREEFYEKLSEWRSAPVVAEIPDTSKALNSSKHISGDSYDSDEGWVDISDSEDEKLLLAENRSHKIIKTDSNNCLNRIPKPGTKSAMTVENASYDVTGQTDIYSKLGDSNISRSPSSEHLYETIADIENSNDNITSDVSSVINECTAKDENSPENDFDSGEWSTESSSPVLGESSNIHKHYSLKDTSTPISHKSPVTRFTLSADLDYSETAGKKTFIKSVLGKKPLNSKKRRMSHFFVPWLVSNQEYGSSRSPKLTVRKQMTTLPRNISSPPKSRRTFVKSKRSQSIPTCSSISCASESSLSFPSTEFISDINKAHSQGPSSLPEQRSERSDISIHLSPEAAHSLSQRSSFASSTYLRADQLQSIPSVRSRSNVTLDTAVDVAVQKIFKRSTSGESEHSYILFQPIKEEEVPLYQFYERNIKERVALCRSPDSLSPVLCPSVYENSTSHDCGHKFPVGKSQLSVIEQLSPDAKESKMLWCELPEVKDSGILERISAQELKLQEAAFDFIQSQASYIRSLKVLDEHFIQSPEFSESQSSLCVLSKHEHDVLFCDIVRVKEVSERLMADLTARWSDGILIPDICDIIYQHATLPSFSVYVKYCSNRVYQERTLKELKETRLCFLEVLRKLESNPTCQGLSLESFLFLPMQHIARLPLLLDNIFRWLSSDSPSYNICKMGLEAVHKVFMDCNESARKMERLEEMFVLNKQLEFKECKVIPLISASRWLLKRGEVMKLEFDKKTFGRSNRCVRVPLYIFLFNDLLVVTKRKSEDSYTVIDYCPQEKVQAMAVDAKDLQLPMIVPSSCRYLIYLTLFNNHQGSAVDMILSCTLLSERTRWIEAIHPVTRTTSSDVWDYDCPQVQCVRSYIAQQPDELSLQESDVVTIQRKMNDGWYEGRRLRDGLQGWFPASYTMDIPCCRARASNLRQCYRLLMLSQKNQTKPQGS